MGCNSREFYGSQIIYACSTKIPILIKCHEFRLKQDFQSPTEYQLGANFPTTRSYLPQLARLG